MGLKVPSRAGSVLWLFWQLPAVCAITVFFSYPLLSVEILIQTFLSKSYLGQDMSRIFLQLSPFLKKKKEINLAVFL